MALAAATLPVGAVLAALAPEGHLAGSQAGAAGVALLVWCYCDGTVGRRLHWGLAALEALLRLRLALAWARVLLDGPDLGAGG